MKFSLHPFVLGTLVLGAAPLGAQTQVDLPAARDCTLYEDPNGNLANGSGAGMFCGIPFTGLVYRSAIYFDVAAAVPAGSRILSATLTLEMDRTVSGPAAVALHPITQSWSEGPSRGQGTGGGVGSVATTGDVTWLHRSFPGSLWTNPGGDFVATASATQTVGGLGPYDWTSAALAADVQGWLDAPATNHGWMIRGDETTLGTSKRFVTKESSFGQAPRLRLVYGPAASVTVVGTGCGTGPFTASGSSLPQLGGTLGIALAGGAAFAPYVTYIAAGPAPFAIPLSPSCVLDLDPFTMFSLLQGGLDGSGSGGFQAAVPNDPLLLLGPIQMQVFSIEPGFEIGIVSSPRLALQVGF